MTREPRSPLSLLVPALVTGLVLAGTVIAVSTESAPPPQAADPRPTATGVVLDEVGRPVGGARLRVGELKSVSDARGRFSMPLDHAAIVNASASGHLSRAAMLDPEKPSSIVLTSDEARSLSLRFGGDVMLGRRYFSGEAGRPAVLKRSANRPELAAVFSEVEPFLKDADLTVVNLETALVAHPWTGVDSTRPKDLHPTKDIIVTSPLATAGALALSGVDVVSLSNNHVFDALDKGVDNTIEALDAAGVAHYGAGRTVEEAWRPAYVTRRGQTVAFVGCTTIDGRKSGLSYVAEARHGGAAECDLAQLEEAVKIARARTTTVVVSIHGGIEYRRSQLPEVRELAQVAQRAGAHVVVGSHPHVVGGLVATGNNLFAESMGNLTFDQELWPTFPSYLLRVDVRDGIPVSASTDPIVISRYRPRPATGLLADSISRIASGWVVGDTILAGNGARVPLDGKPPASRRMTTFLARDEVRRLARGWYLPPATGLRERVRPGTDLLFGTGSFEQSLIGSTDVAPLWSLAKYGAVTTSASCDASPTGVGLLIARSPLSTVPAVASPEHRASVTPGQGLSVLARLRQASPGSRIEIHWYADESGPSTSVSSTELPTGRWPKDSCRSVRFDVTAPKTAVAAQVFVVLKPPDGGQTIRRLAIDDVTLVDWAPKGRSGRRYDMVEALAAGQVTFEADEPGTAASTPLGSFR